MNTFVDLRRRGFRDINEARRWAPPDPRRSVGRFRGSRDTSDIVDGADAPRPCSTGDPQR